MKKMNFVFLSRVLEGVHSRRGLMLLLMLFLIGFGYNTVSAQYVSSEVAVSRLKQTSMDLTRNWEAIQQSGDQVAIERATLKLDVVSRMLTNLKEGATVKATVEKFISFPSNANHADFQIGDNPKTGQKTGWLKDEILQLLRL
jgi:hypothetical protein